MKKIFGLIDFEQLKRNNLMRAISTALPDAMRLRSFSKRSVDNLLPNQEFVLNRRQFQRFWRYKNACHLIERQRPKILNVS